MGSVNKTRVDALLSRLTILVIGGILIIAPFYAPLTVLVASHLQHFDFLRIWKEIFLSLLGGVILFYLTLHRRQAKSFLRDKLFLACIAYAVLLVGIAIFDLATNRVETSAVIYGLMINLRLVGFFALTYLAFRTHQLAGKFTWWRFVLIPAAFVVGFGLLQMTVLPNDVLSHIGYGKNTIVPFQTVDNQGGFVRIQSTLRGPNPLGAYLVVVTSIVSAFLMARQKRDKWKLFLFLAISLAVLFGTYSRSAWIGVLAAALTLIATRSHTNKLVRKFLIIGLVSGVLAGGTLLVWLRDNYTFQTTVFHSSDRSSAVDSSNFQRANAVEGAARDVWRHPLGQGIGSAGPASLRNAGHPAKLSENYFLQVGQEAGWTGLVGFIALNVFLLKGLYARRNTVLGSALLASLVGLIVVNLMSHAWADDTLAYTWWGLAGVAMARAPTGVIMNEKRKQHGN